MRFSFEGTLRISFSKIVRGRLNARLGRIHLRNTSREPPPRFVTPTRLNLRMQHANSGKWEAYFVNGNSPRRERGRKAQRRFPRLSQISALTWPCEFSAVLKATGYNKRGIVFKLFNQFRTKRCCYQKFFMRKIYIFDFLRLKSHRSE